MSDVTATLTTGRNIVNSKDVSLEFDNLSYNFQFRCAEHVWMLILKSLVRGAQSLFAAWPSRTKYHDSIFCFTLSSGERRASYETAGPRGGLLPQGAITAGVILVATAKPTADLPSRGELLRREAASRNGRNRDHSGESGQHVFHAEAGLLAAKLALSRTEEGLVRTELQECETEFQFMKSKPIPWDKYM